MARLVTRSFTISLDGYGAGPHQSVENPLGVGGEELHDWLVSTRTFKRLQRKDGGDTGIDEDFAARGFEDIGAWIMGRNMFGPVRGEWPDESWRGWWGKNPPYHVPVFVLTHHARKPLEMEGGTTFHFVTGGPDEALKRAQQAAGSRDIRVGGGVQTISQYLQGKRIDEIHLAVSPVLLGAGEHLFFGLNLKELGYRVTEQVASQAATHIVLGRA